MANHAILQIEKCQASYVGNIEAITCASDLDNGNIVNLGGFASGEREIRTATLPVTATLETAEVLIVYTPEVMYEAGKNKKDFYNPANSVARAYHLTVGDIFTITDDGISGTSVVGKYLVPANGSAKLTVADDLSGNTRFAALIIEKGTLGYGKSAATTFQVVKC